MSTNKKSEQSNLSTVLRVTSGNFLEMFDFFWLPVMGALSEKVGANPASPANSASSACFSG